MRSRGRLGRLSRLVGPPLAMVLLVSTTVSGLLLYQSGSHGGPLGNVHVVCAILLTVSVAAHIVDRRKRLAGLVRKGRGRALRPLLANLAMIVVLVASMLTGFAAVGSGFATRHVVISLVLFVAYCVHGSTRIARRMRAAERALPETGPERAAD
ncbi:MAG: hypothetical protein JXA87_10385 [Thermoleophilia bacterium]|nr:hypothetical protein [Thermoleophilia bacterium]